MWARILFVVCLLVAQVAHGKQIEFDEREVVIGIRHNVTDSKAGANPTFLRFPRSVARVDNATMFLIKPSSPAGAEADYRELAVRPRVSSGEQRVEVLLNDGAVIKLKVKITTDARTPTSYDFEPRRVIEDQKKEKSEDGKAPGSELSILRSILQGDTPNGMQKWTSGKEIRCRDASISATVRSVFENEQFRVSRVLLKNESSKFQYRIREENIVLKGQELTRSPLYHVTARILSPRGKGPNELVLTVLADAKVDLSKASLCDAGDQIEVTRR